MRERQFQSSLDLAVSPERAFAWLADYRNLARILDGIRTWEPLGQETAGAGARFEVVMSVFGFRLENVVVLDAWDPPREIAWASESGVPTQSGGWTFTPVEGGVRVNLEIAYQAPRLAPRALVARVDGEVRARLERALGRLRMILEGEDQNRASEVADRGEA